MEVRLTPHERVQQNTVEQIVDFPVPQILEEAVEVAKFVPHE